MPVFINGRPQPLQQFAQALFLLGSRVRRGSGAFLIIDEAGNRTDPITEDTMSHEPLRTVLKVQPIFLNVMLMPYEPFPRDPNVKIPPVPVIFVAIEESKPIPIEIPSSYLNARSTTPHSLLDLANLLLPVTGKASPSEYNLFLESKQLVPGQTLMQQGLTPGCTITIKFR